MNNQDLYLNSLEKLEKYIEREDYSGYDPYDTLNSFIPFKLFGKWVPVLAIQLQKRNLFNIRPFIGIKKEINPKAFGLLLSAYCGLYEIDPQERYLEKAWFFFNWLKENYSKGYAGICWGYNFPWAGPEKYINSFTPSAVVTGFVCKGIFEYLKITKSSEAEKILKSAADFILNDLDLTENENGVCFSYTPVKKDICFNASLLALEVLSMVYNLKKDKNLGELITKGVEFVLHYQKENGCWNYSVNPQTGKEREQIDFHQGYILESLWRIKNLMGWRNASVEKAIKMGLEFYRREQFFENGQSKWRIPKIWPVDIHNQAQGIITFSTLSEYDDKYPSFSKKTAKWTIDYMQDRKGFFYFRKGRVFTNKISYMRWSNAWMFFSLTKLLKSLES